MPGLPKCVHKQEFNQVRQENLITGPGLTWLSPDQEYHLTSVFLLPVT